MKLRFRLSCGHLTPILTMEDATRVRDEQRFYCRKHENPGWVGLKSARRCRDDAPAQEIDWVPWAVKEAFAPPPPPPRHRLARYRVVGSDVGGEHPEGM